MKVFCKAMTAGMFLNAAAYVGTEYDPLKPQDDPGTHVYRLLRLPLPPGAAQGSADPWRACGGVRLVMHPSSVLFRAAPGWLVFTAAAQADSGRYEMQGVTAVQPDWLGELAPHVFATTGPARGPVLPEADEVV